MILNGSKQEEGGSSCLGRGCQGGAPAPTDWNYISGAKLEDQGGISSVVVLESQFGVNRAIRMVHKNLTCLAPERLYNYRGGACIRQYLLNLFEEGQLSQ